MFDIGKYGDPNRLRENFGISAIFLQSRTPISETRMLVPLKLRRIVVKAMAEGDVIISRPWKILPRS